MAVLIAVLGSGVMASGARGDDTVPVASDDGGLTRGDGCFEGCRLRRVDGVSRVDKLERHLARMARSCAALELSFDPAAWRDLVERATAAWDADGGPDEAAVKLLLTRGGRGRGLGLLTISALPAAHVQLRRDGLRVVTLPRGTSSTAYADAPWLLGGVKTLSYAINMAAQREAERRGAHDALFVASDGYALESSTGSLVWSTGRTLHTTPTGATGILAGTTQELLFDRAAAAGWATEHTLTTIAGLRSADVIWLVSSVRGPVDVVDIDGIARVRRPDVDAQIRELAGFPPAVPVAN